MAQFIKNLNPNNLMIVDSLNLAFRYKIPGKNKLVTGWTDDFIRTIDSLARSYDCGQIVVAADMKGSSYRREIFPDYKANRKELAQKQTEEEKQETDAFFKEYERAVEAADKHFTLFRYEGVEADDIAAYIVKRKNDYGFDQIWLISSDRDWDLLVSEDVHRFSTVTRKEITLATWPHEVPPEQYVDFKCLTGDSGDNIPGVNKVGPKTAKKLLDEYGSVFDIYDALPIDGKYVYIKNLNEFGDQLLVNHELMDLITFCEQAIGADNVRDIGMRLMMMEKKS